MQESTHILTCFRPWLGDWAIQLVGDFFHLVKAFVCLKGNAKQMYVVLFFGSVAVHIGGMFRRTSPGQLHFVELMFPIFRETIARIANKSPNSRPRVLFSLLHLPLRIFSFMPFRSPFNPSETAFLLSFLLSSRFFKLLGRRSCWSGFNPKAESGKPLNIAW